MRSYSAMRERLRGDNRVGTQKFASLLVFKESLLSKKVYFCRCKVVKDFCCKILRGKQV